MRQDKNSPIRLQISDKALKRELARQNNLHKRFLKATKGRDLSKPEEGYKAIMRMFWSEP